MRFESTSIPGVTVVESELHRDDRGSFRRLWCSREFGSAELPRPIVQVSLSETRLRGTLRGMHYQLPASREDKLVQCVAGRIYDVAVDLRTQSSAFLTHYGIELSADVARAIFIPAGCAHGFLTLTENCSVLYMMTDFYDAALSTGVRWNDPSLRIDWPFEPVHILPRDAEYPDIDPAAAGRFHSH